MINYGSDEEVQEVGRISDDAIRIKEIGINVYEIEPLPEYERLDNE